MKHLNYEELTGGFLEALEHVHLYESQLNEDCELDQLRELACSALEIHRRRTLELPSPPLTLNEDGEICGRGATVVAGGSLMDTGLTEAELEALREVVASTRKPRGGDTMSLKRLEAFASLLEKRLVRFVDHAWGPYDLTDRGRALVERLEGSK